MSLRACVQGDVSQCCTIHQTSRSLGWTINVEDKKWAGHGEPFLVRPIGPNLYSSDRLSSAQTVKSCCTVKNFAGQN
eukprot:3087767-Amphidinium_carterae.1